MKSLRTDDIPGARPLFRHAPKMFVRERKNHSPSLNLPYQNLSYIDRSQIYGNQKQQINFNRGNNNLLNSNNIQAQHANNSKYFSGYQKFIPINPEKNSFEGYLLQREKISQINKNNKQDVLEKPILAKSKQLNILESQKAEKEKEKNQPMSSRSMKEKQKSLFRGLGFNIITNTKYTYDFEKTFDKKDRSRSMMI